MSLFHHPNPIVIALIVSVALLDTGVPAPHTPQPGSDERKAICDAVREKVLAQASRKLPQPIVFKIDFLRVDEGYAWFEGTPRLKDGSYVPDGFLADIDYIMIVHKTNNAWKVKFDFSRGDVPSDSEAAQLRVQLANVPASIIPDSWRRILKR